jgi:UDP-GlcNAc:undecaprenyl-phosphate GlcNAc-1-phosphate transferase
MSLPLTVVWIVAITNAVNLIDGLDGLATGIALITTSTVGIIALARNDLGTAAASIALAGSLAGFLRFNFNPARIFLGDSGSLFLGFVLAVTAMRGSQKGPTVVALLVPLLVLGLPVMDTGLALARRSYLLIVRGSRTASTSGYVVRNWRQLFLPDRGHIHHSLLELGMSHRRAVVVLYTVGLACASCAFGLVFLRSAWIALLLVAVLVGALVAFVGTLYLRVWKLRSVGLGEPRGSAERAFASPQQTLGR